MILYPAVDLKGGQCVRLLRGEMSQATVFSDDPAGQARRFVAAGCRFLHVVDLDGAFAGKPMNRAAVEAIVAVAGVPVQLGGGIRDRATVEAWLERGVRRVILGTAALTDPAMVKAACRAHPGGIVIGIDARGGRVAVEGWAKESERQALDLALEFEDAGAAAIVYTDIERDGALAGVNVEATAALAQRLTTEVIASGGVASLEDLRALKAHERDGIAGVICGRALYDGRLDLAAALAVVAG
ncbi:MAG TPA: 1-(5-phosphoribosyl)-5-[(5-phosphoribosylamino)methylideneamino]imidazole-4-carboxamide isomerase [Stellaceae bacterium]|nr:1-(5-phosphoribosyl)-5-[(5-phosphoribosylamino)methylideneamino]imidazole-4-carboxamide isomerase [Stellaceae bacterium]